MAGQHVCEGTAATAAHVPMVIGQVGTPTACADLDVDEFVAVEVVVAVVDVVPILATAGITISKVLRTHAISCS